MSTFSFSNFLRGLIFFVVLVIIFEGVVSYIPDEMVADVAQQSGMRIKNEQSLKPSEVWDILILGDCFFFAGVNPAVLDQMLNVRSFNLAVNRVQTYMISYVLFNNVVKHSFRKPRLIVLGVHASSLYYPLKMDIDTLRQTVLPFFDVSDVLLNELSFKLKAQVLWHHWLTKVPSIKKQYLLRDNWLSLVRHFEREKYSRIEESLSSNRGFFNEDLTGQRQQFRVNFNLPAEDTSIREYNDRYIKKILESAGSLGIKVVLVTNSYRNDLAQRINYNIMFDVDYFEELKRLYPCVIGVLNMHDVVPDPDKYVDITHLDGKGAAIFTEELARRIKMLSW